MASEDNSANTWRGVDWPSRLRVAWLALFGRLSGEPNSGRMLPTNHRNAEHSQASLIESLIGGLPGPAIVLDRYGGVVAFNAAASAIAPSLRRGEPALITLRMPELVEAIRRATAGWAPQRVEFFERVPLDRWFEAFVTPVKLPGIGGANADILLMTFNDLTPLRLKESSPDLIVLDWMLPGLSGIELCRRLRARPETRQLPIIMLTARGEESEKVRGLATGADDYIVKPFSVPELLARVRALLRRANPERVAVVLNIGDIEIDREKKRVSRNGRPIDLGPTEYRLLEFLMERPGRVFSREQLLDGVWGSDIYIDERTVDVHVGRLRKAINRGHASDPIRTVRGAGYALDDRFGRAL
jgi:two-component system, OmpR family, phosphate regulon response regulator PhoB